MTDDLVSLDDCRKPESMMASEVRRDAMIKNVTDEAARRKCQAGMDAQTEAKPTSAWIEATVKARFLIRRNSERPEAMDARIQTLIGALRATWRVRPSARN